jgi:hypothetical protein
VGAFSVVLTIVVLVAVAVFILLFERKRAVEIEDDLKAPREMDDDRPRHRME